MIPDPLDAALKLLPHGPEFRFLDHLSALESGRSAVGEFTIPTKADFLRGHFPSSPMMPGVLMVEAIAQLAGVAAQTDPQMAPLDDLKLTAIRAAKILGTARPGERLRIEARVDGRMGGLIQASGVVWHGDRKLVEASVVLAGTAPPATLCRDPATDGEGSTNITNRH